MFDLVIDPALSPSPLHGLSQIMRESDYPHADSAWPDSDSLADVALSTLPADEADAIRFANASVLFDWPAPPTGT